MQFGGYLKLRYKKAFHLYDTSLSIYFKFPLLKRKSVIVTHGPINYILIINNHLTSNDLIQIVLR